MLEEFEKYFVLSLWLHSIAAFFSVSDNYRNYLGEHERDISGKTEIVLSDYHRRQWMLQKDATLHWDIRTPLITRHVTSFHVDNNQGWVSDKYRQDLWPCIAIKPQKLTRSPRRIYAGPDNFSLVYQCQYLNLNVLLYWLGYRGIALGEVTGWKNLPRLFRIIRAFGNKNVLVRVRHSIGSIQAWCLTASTYI